MKQRYHIQFPPQESSSLGQDEVFFYLWENDARKKLRFHDYHEIYSRPGLYEQVFYERLKCNSPRVIGELIKNSLDSVSEWMSELRVLDMGAGNGIMGEVLKNEGVSRLVAADIIPQAREAAYRDRPQVYDEYYVADFTNLPAGDADQLREWGFNCLTCVAALGFGDIPPAAFFQALQLVKPDGWVAFNIKETFLADSDATGFSRFVRKLIFSEYLEIHHLRRYRHRLSMEGTPLFYYALVARKMYEIPSDFLRFLELEG